MDLHELEDGTCTLKTGKVFYLLVIGGKGVFEKNDKVYVFICHGAAPCCEDYQIRHTAVHAAVFIMNICFNSKRYYMLEPEPELVELDPVLVLLVLELVLLVLELDVEVVEVPAAALVLSSFTS